MSTIHIDTARSASTRSATSADTQFKRPLLSSIRWSAVIAGVAVGISVQLLLTLLGIASGLSMTGMQEGEVPSTSTLLWAGIALLLSGFAGAFVTGYLCGLKRRTDGMVHGVVSWAVTTLLFVILATSAGGSLLSGMFSEVNAAENASLAAWLVFVAAVLSLALSAVGGALGTITAKRAVWSDEGGTSHGGVLVESGGV